MLGGDSDTNPLNKKHKTTLLDEIAARFEDIGHYKGNMNDNQRNQIHAIIFASCYHRDIGELRRVVHEGRSKDNVPQGKVYRSFEWINDIMDNIMKTRHEQLQFNWRSQDIDGDPFKVVMNSGLVGKLQGEPTVEIKLLKSDHTPVTFYPVLTIGHWIFTRKNPKD